MNGGVGLIPGLSWFRYFCLFLAFFGFLSIQQGPVAEDNHAPQTVSCEPQPPLDLDLAVTGFQPSPPGGIATIRVTLLPTAEMGEVTVSGRLNQGMSFLDGSAEKTWRVNVPVGTTAEFTDEILVPDDGLFVIVLQAEAVRSNGQPVHRSRGLKIWAGVQPPQPRQRGKVLEFTGEPLP